MGAGGETSVNGVIIALDLLPVDRRELFLQGDFREAEDCSAAQRPLIGERKLDLSCPDAAPNLGHRLG